MIFYSEMATMKKQEEERITNELCRVMYTTKPEEARNATDAATFRGLYLNSCDEVYPGIYIGDRLVLFTFIIPMVCVHSLNEISN